MLDWLVNDTSQLSTDLLVYQKQINQLNLDYWSDPN